MSESQKQTEANNKTKKATLKEKVSFSFENLFKTKEDKLPDVVKEEVKQNKTKSENQKEPSSQEFKTSKVGANKTAEAIHRNGGAGLIQNANLMEALQNIMMDPDLQHDEISDEEAAGMIEFEVDIENMYFIDEHTIPEKRVLFLPAPTTDNLPAVINQQIALYSPLIEPDWHQIKSLPGYIQKPIRSLGRQVFANFTMTKIEDIQMISTVTNTQNEVNAVTNWIAKECIRDDNVELDFSKFAEGVRAKVSLWNAENYTFLVVQDDYGNYVYGWAGGRATKLANTKTGKISNRDNDQNEEQNNYRPRLK